MWSPDAHFTTLAAAVEDEGARTASAEVRIRSRTGGDADIIVTPSFVDRAEAKFGRMILYKWSLVWCSVNKPSMVRFYEVRCVQNQSRTVSPKAALD